MGHVYRPTYSKPLPPEAEVFTRKGERFARWRDGKGRKRIAKVTTGRAGKPVVMLEAGTYTAEYRDGAGLIARVPTGCRSLDAARTVLGELERRADKVRSGITTAAEDSVMDHQATPLAEHVAAYLDHLRTKRGKGGKPKVSARHVANVEHQLNRIVAGCGFERLRDVNRSAVERWLKRELEATKPLAARTLNAHVAALAAFCNWCVESKRLVASPLARPPKLDEKADRRRQRRALTEDELRRLLHVARLRPVAEYGRQTVRLPEGERSGRRTWSKAPLTFDAIDAAAERGRQALAKRPDYLAQLERAGRERSLIYKALVLTGLRRGELASLTVGQLELEPGPGQTCYATLRAADEKAGRGADVPLRGDLAADLGRWLSEGLEARREAARATGGPLPAKLPPETRLFDVPSGLLRVLNNDAKVAGIPKRDERGRSVCLHGLRHTFGTMLSKGGVSPRTAQAAMRHSTIDLTMNTYTDPRLLDVPGAMNVLPAFPLDDDSSAEAARATGTEGRCTPAEASGLENKGFSDGRLWSDSGQGAEAEARKSRQTPDEPAVDGPSPLVAVLVGATGKSCISEASADKTAGRDARSESVVSGANASVRQSLATGDGMEPKGIEPSTSALRTQRSPN